MARHDVIIVGGGISGLSLAHCAVKKGLSPLVIDRSERLGGTFHTHRVGDFWFELGAHTCYNSYGNFIDLLNDIGLLENVVKPGRAGYRLFSSGEINSISSQFDLIELAMSLPKFFGAKQAGETVRSYYSRVLGRNNFDRVIGPMFSAVICQEAKDFPADMLFKRREKRKGVLKKFTLPGGIQTVVEKIAGDPAITKAPGKEVREIEYRSGMFYVTTEDGGSYESGILAAATPSAVAARMLQKSFPSLSERLSTIAAEKVETVGVIIKKGMTKMRPIAALAASGDMFYSFVSRDTFPDALFRAFAFHFKATAGSLDVRLERIASVLGTRNFEHVVTAEHVIPALRLGHRHVIEEIDRLLQGVPLLLSGNYFSGLAIEDCVSRSLQECNRVF